METRSSKELEPKSVVNGRELCVLHFLSYMCSSPGEELAFQKMIKPQGKGYSTCLWSKQWDVDPTSFECLGKYNRLGDSVCISV
jgi:hypothetical protein